MNKKIAAFTVLLSVLLLFVIVSIPSEANAQYSAQQRLMAKRAAKADALRNLAEMIYGVKLRSGTKVKDFVTQSDVIRMKLETVLLGAQEVDYFEQQDGTAEVTVEITPAAIEDILGKKIDYENQTFRAKGYGAPSGISQPPPPLPMPQEVSVVRAKGNGAEPNDPSMGQAERMLMGKRAAKLDAMRNLLEQIYGVRVSSKTYVRDFVTQSDDIRAKVNAFIQGARVVSERAIGGGAYETEVEIDVEPLTRTLGPR